MEVYQWQRRFRILHDGQVKPSAKLVQMKHDYFLVSLAEGFDIVSEFPTYDLDLFKRYIFCPDNIFRAIEFLTNGMEVFIRCRCPYIRFRYLPVLE